MTGLSNARAKGRQTGDLLASLTPLVKPRLENGVSVKKRENKCGARSHQQGPNTEPPRIGLAKEARSGIDRRARVHRPPTKLSESGCYPPPNRPRGQGDIPATKDRSDQAGNKQRPAKDAPQAAATCSPRTGTLQWPMGAVTTSADRAQGARGQNRASGSSQPTPRPREPQQPIRSYRFAGVVRETSQSHTNCQEPRESITPAVRKQDPGTLGKKKSGMSLVPPTTTTIIHS